MYVKEYLSEQLLYQKNCLKVPFTDFNCTKCDTLLGHMGLSAASSFS